MEVVNPVGRDFSLENDADYSTINAACRCVGSSQYTTGKKGGTCSCSDDPNGTLGTNAYKG